MNECLEKLATSILEIERLSNHQNQLLTQAIGAAKDLNARDTIYFLPAKFPQILNRFYCRVELLSIG
jgi:hypothetical protein